MNLAKVDFQQLRIKHILFKSKVRSILYGGTFDEAFFSGSGPVNTWFSSIGQANYGQEPGIRELMRVHQEATATALQLFNLYKTGRIEQALDGLQNIEVNSEKFLGLLAQLEQKLS